MVTSRINAQKVLELALTLPSTEQKWLAEQFNQFVYDELPERATVDEAIELYLADKCSLGRAAELAGVTRWDMEVKDLINAMAQVERLTLSDFQRTLIFAPHPSRKRGRK